MKPITLRDSDMEGWSVFVWSSHGGGVGVATESRIESDDHRPLYMNLDVPEVKRLRKWLKKWLEQNTEVTDGNA